MANQNKRYGTAYERHSLDLVEEWLHLESLAKPQRRHGLHPNNAYSKSQQLYRTQIPKRMDQFRQNIDSFLDESRDEATSLGLGRLVLESASLAQHGFILGRIARGDNIMTALDESWHTLQNFKNHVRAKRVQLPDLEKLNVPIQEAISSYTRQPYGHYVHTYVGMAALSATAVLNLRNSTDGAFVLPSPGMNSEAPDRWDYNPLVSPKRHDIT